MKKSTESTFECSQNHSCLDKDHKKMCKIQDIVTDKYMMCSKKEEIQNHCDHCTSVGDQSICSCEVRTNFTKLKLNSTRIVS